MQVQGRARLDLQCLAPAGRVLLDFSALAAEPGQAYLQGAVVNISSIGSQMPRGGNPAYGVAKATQDALTKNLAFELAPKGVRVNAVLPGERGSGLRPSVSSMWCLLHSVGKLHSHPTCTDPCRQRLMKLKCLQRPPGRRCLRSSPGSRAYLWRPSWRSWRPSIPWGGWRTRMRSPPRWSSWPATQPASSLV